MKKYLNKKSIAFLSIASICLIFLIVILIVPIGSMSTKVLIYETRFFHRFDVLSSYDAIGKHMDTPFTTHDMILVWQTVVFTLVGIVFIVFLTLFLVELKRAGAFERAHRPTKTELMQAQIDEMQKQIDELKKGD